MKQKEGYLHIDNRASGGHLLEAATLTCSHCQNQIVRNPSRERARAFCPKCDHYICDDCERTRVLTGTCRTFSQVIDTVLDQAAKGVTMSNPQMLLARNS